MFLLILELICNNKLDCCVGITMKTHLWLAFIFYYCYFPVSNVLCYRPVFIVHGILSFNYSMKPLATRIKQIHPGTKVYISSQYEGWSSLEPMWRQVEKYGDEFSNISNAHPEGFNLIGYSQGGLIARALLEKYPNHNVRNFISLSSPQAGQYGTKFLHLYFPELALEKAYEVFYTVGGQLTSVGNYWNDPHQQPLFLQYSAFLPLLNNEISQKMNASYKNGIIRLRKLVLIGGPDDGVITPWQSSLFGYYNDKEEIVDMKSRSIYQSSSLGLSDLDERGRLHTFTVEGVEHHLWRKNISVIDNYILPFLD